MTVCAILGQKEEIIRHASDLLELSEEIARIIPQHPTMEGDLLRETISEHRVIARIHCKSWKWAPVCSRIPKRYVRGREP